MAVTESAVDRHVEAGVRARLQSIPDWRGLNNPWMPNDEEDVQYSYINLQQNPERFTGYQARASPGSVLACSAVLVHETVASHARRPSLPRGSPASDASLFLRRVSQPPGYGKPYTRRAASPTSAIQTRAQSDESSTVSSQVPLPSGALSV